MEKCVWRRISDLYPEILRTGKCTKGEGIKTSRKTIFMDTERNLSANL